MVQWMGTQVNIRLCYCEERDESNGPWLVWQYKDLSLSARFCCVCGGSACRENHKDGIGRCRLLVTLIAADGCPKENDKMTRNCCTDNSRFLSLLSIVLLWASIVDLFGCNLPLSRRDGRIQQSSITPFILMISNRSWHLGGPSTFLTGAHLFLPTLGKN